MLFNLIAPISSFALMLSFQVAAASEPKIKLASSKPNVVVILTDDQSIGDVGAYGAADIQTPNIDRLAASGIRFTQFYAAAPICSPSRAGLLTGRAPERIGVPANAASFAGSLKGIPLREITLPEMLRREGYRSALIGKWHLGYDQHLRPQNQGFDHSFGFLVGAIDNYSHFTYWREANRHDLYRNNVETHEPGQFMPDLMVDEALNFVDETPNGTPFFVYFALGLPHYPYQGDPHWIEYYDDQGVPYPRNLYNAFVSTMDDRIGALLDGLEARGLREDTIIIFQSDHGHSTEARAHYGGGDTQGLRGAKRSLFEGGLRVPAIISWPGTLQSGVADQMLSSLDWMPTLADLLDADTSEIAFDGQSMTGILEDQTAPEIRNRLHWEFFEQWAVREGDWKLLYKAKDTTHGFDPAPFTGTNELFLVNLLEDPEESTNVSKHHPEKLSRLLAAREAMRVKDQPRDWEIGVPVMESRP